MSACVPGLEVRDAVVLDARAEVDAGQGDARAAQPDAAVIEPDAAVIEPDATAIEPDATVIEPDAAEPDAGSVSDAGFYDAGADDPDTSQLGDTPYFTTGAELCDYVNQARMASSGHDRYRGGTNPGYHTMRTWPLTFVVDPQLMLDARAEAVRLESGGGVTGAAHGDGIRYRRIYADGVNTSAYQITARDEPGDWNASYFKSALINANAAARQYLYYQDPGGAGPVLRSMGCAGATAGGGAVWWVVILRP